MIGKHDTLTCLTHHRPMDGCLVRIVSREAMFGVRSVNPNKGLIKKHLADVALGHITYEREPVAAQRAPGHGNLDFRQVAELHRDVDGVGDDRDSLTMTNAPRQLSGCGTGTNRDGFAV